ncbi:Uracil DNA glycosylase superfamily protein [Planctomycetes bacterium Pan216]|uniref:Type-4 uracil-DNA glycosylase n=1 Tax=Kolteria novifilia TaxID=2527975 RepID=A0A518BD50_9BACT|nr:Uracil DNA glycosylase superfamily protein [Planctomycetes bacterium Pan216]
MDRAWRYRLEAMRRAGLEYVDKGRLEEASPSPAPSIDAPMESAVEAETAMASSPPSPIEVVAEPVTIHQAAEGPEPGMPRKSKSDLLKLLSEEVADCTCCSVLAEHRTQTVFSDGSSKAELCFVGEAPGADEDRQGVPFVGRAGQLLTKIIEACKLQRDEVYICNVLKCRPPDNRNPMPDEIENCRPFLERQLEILKPKMMVALGKYAAAHLLREPPAKVPITRLRGQIREYCGIPFMITLHPAYLLRNPNAKRDVWEDMKEVMRQIGRPVD